MNCGLLCEIVNFIKNIFKFTYETFSLKNRSIIFISLIAVVLMLALMKIKPKFLYDLLSPFYNNKNKEEFSFENLQNILKEEKAKREDL